MKTSNGISYTQSEVKNYSYEELTVGQTESFTRTVTEKEMKMFREMTGDKNPLHCDDDYAKLLGYKRRVVYGMLTASYLSALAGMYLPGLKSLIYEVEVKFVKPNVDIGGEIIVSGTVTQKSDVFKRIVLQVEVTGADGKQLLRGKMKVGVSESGGI